MGECIKGLFERKGALVPVQNERSIMILIAVYECWRPLSKYSIESNNRQKTSRTQYGDSIITRIERRIKN